ncbi:hypothetical protein HF200_07655 [Streptomyces galbus]|uniref:Secreted protein n=1 Tax=Streptomyces galbus TaxID=33898 RepID=A0ABX1IGM1_STRGB|nr:hypothetical protein [Streptomyces galbus]NKQ24337.1 hypothetical protein [Streptomyces galbus]
MERRGHTLRLTAVAALVVLALTGFSTRRGHGGHHGGGGGGCSSSHQDHDSSSTGGTSGSRHHDYDDDDDDYYASGTGGSSGGSSQPAATTGTLRDADVELLDCATEKTPYATVRVTNPNGRGGSFTVTVDFLDAASNRVERRTAHAFVAANGTATVRVGLSGPGAAARADHCLAGLHATAG